MARTAGLRAQLSLGKSLYLGRVLAGNLLVWVVVPYYFRAYIAALDASDPISSVSFVLAFGGSITALVCASAVIEGTLASAVLDASANIGIATYIWLVLSRASLTVMAGTSTIVVGFSPVAFVLMLPFLWWAVKAPGSYLFGRSKRGADSAGPSRRAS